MGVYWKWVFVALVGLVLTACSANHNSIYRMRSLSDEPAVITLDAKQRSILTAYRLLTADGKPDKNSVRAFCAEPSPDVFSVIAQSLSAGGSFGKTADPTSIEAALNLAYSSAEQGSTIPRTQTVNMLRELMFRTCERFLSGGYDPTELSLQAIRDQRLMVSILAIEQLTGTVTPKAVIIAAAGSGGAGVSGDAIVRLDDARKARDAAATTLEAATAKYEQTNGGDKICDAIKGKNESELTDDQKTKVKPCSDDRTAKEKASSANATATAAYQELSGLARTGGVSVASTISSHAESGVNQADVASIENVAKVVKDIVTLNFSDNTETMMFCLRVLRQFPDVKQGEKALNISKEQDTNLKSVCVSYLDAGVRAAEERLQKEISDSRAARAVEVKSNFKLFWTDTRKAAFHTLAGRQAFANWLWTSQAVAKKKDADCFVSAADEGRAFTCFNAMPSNAQRRAIQN